MMEVYDDCRDIKVIPFPAPTMKPQQFTIDAGTLETDVICSSKRALMNDKNDRKLSFLLLIAFVTDIFKKYD